MPIELWSLALQAIVEGLKLANKPLSDQYVEKATDLQLRINQMKQVPYDEQDDGEMTALIRDFRTYMNGAILAFKGSNV